MPYRPTERTEARKAATHERIVEASRDLIAHGGYAEAQVGRRGRPSADVAVGTVYRHFPSKAELFAEVFRSASQHEVAAVIQAAAERTARAPTDASRRRRDLRLPGAAQAPAGLRSARRAR